MSATVIVVEFDAPDFSWADEGLRTKNLMRALNSASRWTRTQMDKEIRRQVNFPASYLRPSQDRLVVSKPATSDSLETVIQGRERATSLARFVARGTPLPGERTSGGKLRQRATGAVRVAVKPGRYKPIKGAFLVKLRGGEAGNLGLAIRTKDGPPTGAYHPTPLKSFGPNVWLLYGPSVNQVLWSVRNNGGVISDIEDDALNKMNEEFTRLMDVEEKRGR